MNLLSLLNILENTGLHMVSIQYGNMLAKANFRSIETSQLIYFANQLTGLYIMGNLIFSEFVHENGWNPSSCVFYIRNAFYYTNKRSSLVETTFWVKYFPKTRKITVQVSSIKFTLKKFFTWVTWIPLRLTKLVNVTVQYIQINTHTPVTTKLYLMSKSKLFQTFFKSRYNITQCSNSRLPDR